MRIREVGLESARGEVRLTGVVERASGERLEVWFAYPESAAELVATTADPFVPLVLPACAFRGEPLEIDPPLSPRLHHTLPEIRSLYRQWWDTTTRDFDILARAGDAIPPRGHATGSFSSGGVDSSYTMVKTARDPRPHLPPYRYLVYMHGLETPLERELAQRIDLIPPRLEEVARARGLELIAGSTNLRTHFPLHWLKEYFGAGLSGVASSLSRGISAMLLPASDSFEGNDTPLGSHPLLDPLWSTEATQIIHDGCERTRCEKIAYLVEHAPELVERLRICLANDGGPENCGRCLKCVRMTLTLGALGRLDLARSIPREPRPDWEDFLVTTATRPGRVRFIREIRELARAHEAPAQFLSTLDRVIERMSRHLAWIERFERWSERPGLGWIQGVRNARGALRRAVKRMERR